MKEAMTCMTESNERLETRLMNVKLSWMLRGLSQMNHSLLKTMEKADRPY